MSTTVRSNVSVRAWSGLRPRRNSRRAVAVGAAAVLLAIGGAARGQILSNSWVLHTGGNWSTTANWTNGIPNAPGTFVFLLGSNGTVNGFTGGSTVNLDQDATIGYLMWGDLNRDQAVDLRDTGGTRTLTFDTGDGKMALLSHNSGDMNRDIGNGGDDTDARIYVADLEGLYIENAFQTLTLYGGATNSRALDGGGHDIVKAEDGTLVIQRIVTNVNNFVVRDGKVQWNLEGNVGMMPSIANLVVGAAPGVVDTGAAHPLATVVHPGEGTANDRMQYPIVQMIGLNDTNYATKAQQVTNTFNLTMNRGLMQLYNRPSTNGAPAVLAGNVQLNGNADEVIFWTESQDLGALTSNVRQMVFSGSFSGTGGFTKVASGEMTMVGVNPFTGLLNVNRGFDRGYGRYGGVALRDGGRLTGVAGLNLIRNGSFYIDNSSVNHPDRINDDAWLTARGRTRFEMMGNALASSSETIGAVTNLYGALFFELDANDATPQGQTLNLASLTRSQGGVVSFHASDRRQGVWATNAPLALRVNLLDGGASLTQVGSGAGPGLVNRSVAVGVFGGDGVDLANIDPVNISPNRADEFMTVDAGRLRTLDPLTEMVNLGNRTSNALVITQASAAPDANVNINFQVMTVDLDGNLAAGISPELITKLVVGSPTFNSIRLGIVSNAPGSSPNDPGRTLLLGDGTRLTSESGMFLVGRDTGSTGGDDSPGGNVFMYRGLLDLDGTANNREAVIHNASGNNFYMRTPIEAGNGLTKSGDNPFVLDAPNRITGTVHLAQGVLYPRNSLAFGSATQVVVHGDGIVQMQWGIAVMGTDLRATELPYSKQILIGEAQHNVWGGNIILQNYDPQGQIWGEPRVVAGSNNQNPSLTILGDIGIDDGLPTADVAIFDPLRLSISDSSGILNLYGTFGDRLVNGQAAPVDPTVRGWTRIESGNFSQSRASAENDVLRFRIDGPSLANMGDELSVHIANPWKAAGRIYAEQGTIRFLGDPAAGKGEFWDAQTLTNANFANGFSGFQLGGDGTDAGGSATFLLTKDGQTFNAERWTVSNPGTISAVNTNTTITMGLEHFGPANATVKIGNDFNDGSVDGADNRITFDREFRVLAHNGWDSAAGTASVGRVNIVQTLRGNERSALTKVGNGVVALQGPSNVNYDESNDIRNFLLLGGELILDRSPGASADLGLRRTRDNGAYLTLAGGDLTHLGSTSITTEMMSSNLVIRAGDSTVRSRTSGPAGTNALFIATATGSTVTRFKGGTVNFERDLTAGGNAAFHFGLAANTRLGSWAVVSSNGLPGFSWAATDVGTNVTAFSGYTVNGFGAGLHTDVTLDQVLAADQQTASVRFDAGAVMNLAGWQLDVTDGGILVTPNASDGFAGPTVINGGTLTSTGGELIFQNYNTAYGFGLGANITGAVALTHSGTGRTTLSGVNTFDGIVYLNGGTLAIDSAARLGNVTNSLEMRGGALEMTADTDLGTRRITLGGDGGTFRVSAGATGTIAGVMNVENNLLDLSRLNNGHGDLIKEGAGTLVLGGANTLSNGYQGLTDIRAGTVLITRSNSFVLGSSKSFYDGTIIRSNATLEVNVGGLGANNQPLDLRDWLVLEGGSTLRIIETNSGFVAWKWNGVVDVRGDAVIDVVNTDDFVLNQDAGYVMGSGTIVKRGNGPLMFYEYSPEFTGGVTIEDGRVQLVSMSQNALPNAGTITLGLNDTVNRGEVAFHVRAERDEMASVTDVRSSFVVQGNSDGTRIGTFRQNHNDVVNFRGDIDLTNFDTSTNLRELQLYMNDETVAYRKAAEADMVREESFMNFLGNITGGDKRIRTYIALGGTPNTQDRGAQFTNEIDFCVFYTLSGTNTGWTGSLEVGNRTGTGATDQGPDFDKQHFVRFGRDDGAATLAIGPNNMVVLRNNAHLQAYGSQATIGSLFSDGDSGGDGYFGNQAVADTWLENGGTQAGSFTIVQSSNRLFQGIIRDGTVSNPGADDSPAAPLGIVKAGPATLMLDQINPYTGPTRIMAGSLALTGTATIAASPTIQIDAGASLVVTNRTGGTMNLASGQTLKGNGTFTGGLIADAGSTVAPGTSPGALTVDGSLTMNGGSTFSVELNGLTAGTEFDQLIMGGNTLTLANPDLIVALNFAPSPGDSFAIVTGLSGYNPAVDGIFTNKADGSTFMVGSTQVQIDYNPTDITLTVIPEPATLGLAGLAVVAALLRRRRRR